MHMRDYSDTHTQLSRLAGDARALLCEKFVFILLVLLGASSQLEGALQHSI
jgi:hypothetical protein